jgi:hypothetical protein
MRNKRLGFKSSLRQSSPNKRNRSFILNLFWKSARTYECQYTSGLHPSITCHDNRIYKTEEVCVQYYDCNSHTDYPGCWFRWQKHEARVAAHSCQSLDKLKKKNNLQPTLCHSLVPGQILCSSETSAHGAYLLHRLCRIWGSQSGSYEEFYLLGYNAV